MIYNTFELHQEGSLPGAHLVTYIQEYSEAMTINDIPEPPTERRSLWR